MSSRQRLAREAPDRPRRKRSAPVRALQRDPRMNRIDAENYPLELVVKRSAPDRSEPDRSAERFRRPREPELHPARVEQPAPVEKVDESGVRRLENKLSRRRAAPIAASFASGTLAGASLGAL